MKNISITAFSFLLLTSGITPAIGQSATAANGLPGSKPTTVMSAASSGKTSANYSYQSGSSDSVPPLVIEFTAVDDTALAEMEEDLSVMTRLIEKSLEEGLGDDVPPDRMGIRMWATYGGRSIRAMHLEGFGAMFMIKVNVTLLGPSAVEKKDPQPAADSDWERARQEVHRLKSPDAPQWPTSSGPEYNSENVEALKKALLHALQNGSRIRHLKADEFIGITVFGAPIPAPRRSNYYRTLAAVDSFGSAPGAGVQLATDTPRAEAKSGSVPRPNEQDTFTTARASQQGTVLTLRVRKSDADDFSKGTLDFESFRKKAAVNAYAGNGYGISSVNSWSRQGGSALQRK